ncbi:hypothetical protein JTB14_015277 [Gonioctena quinquepunctata]|nr:hypothetical protein JTB14_015277 [Gonioctena quinquepunctata]
MRRMPPNWNHLQKRFHGLFHNNKQLVTQENTKPTYKATEIMKHISNQPKNVRGTLEQVFVYPIKSCGAFQVSESWILTPKGLKYDREWMIVNSMGVCLAQKQNRKLCLIKPVIDLKRKTLELHCKGQPNIEVDLEHSSNMKEAYLCQSKVCGNRVTGWDCGDEISDWLSETLDMPGLRLLRQYEPENEDETTQLSFANQAQYLLLNSKSVEWLRNQVPSTELKETLRSTIQRFRPNFVVRFEKPFEENELLDFFVDYLPFETVGKCTRCQMICIDQETGNISKEPLLTLSRVFKGKINFGIYVNQKYLDKIGFRLSEVISGTTIKYPFAFSSTNTEAGSDYAAT